MGVVLTAGARGASYAPLGCEGSVPAFRVRVGETTGAAGDASTAALLHSLLGIDLREASWYARSTQGQTSATGANTTRQSIGGGAAAAVEESASEAYASTVERAVVFACAAGALACTRTGAMASQPSYMEIEALMAKQRPGE